MTIINDEIFEEDEIFSAHLSSTSSGLNFAQLYTTVTIVDDDGMKFHCIYLTKRIYPVLPQPEIYWWCDNIYIHTYARTHTYMYICIGMYIYTHTYVHICTYRYIHTYTYLYTHTHSYTHSIYIYIYLYNIYIYIYIYSS